MNHCPRCGTQLASYTVRCPNCGELVIGLTVYDQIAAFFQGSRRPGATSAFNQGCGLGAGLPMGCCCGCGMMIFVLLFLASLLFGNR
jgi:hypothetical protein